MNLAARTFLLLLLVTAISFGTAVTVQKLITIPAFEEFEANADRKDVERVLTGFDVVRNAINVMTADYALWDDTYQHFYSYDQRYLDSNFVIETFLTNSIDLVAFADLDGNIFWSKLADTDTETFRNKDFYDPTEFKLYLADARDAFPEAPVSKSGMVSTSLGTMVFASYSVLRSDESGESPGSLLIGRFLSDSDIDEIQQLVKIPFKISTLNKNQFSKIKNQTLDTQFRNADNTFEWYLTDIDNQPLLKLSLQLGPSTIDLYRINQPAIIAFILTTLSWIVLIAHLNRAVIRPMMRIGTHLQGIRNTEDYSLRINSARTDEVGELSNECDLLIQHIEQQNTQLGLQSEELKKLSLQDGLTGLSNRRHLDQMIENYWSSHRREQLPLSFILCDIDYFKLYNDNYGHQAGDDALKHVSKAILQSLSRDTDKAARYGGEEFALLLADTNAEGVMTVARRLQMKLANLGIRHRGSKIAPLLTASIGCTTITPANDVAPRELIAQADKALYRAKGSGRNRIVLFDTTIEQTGE